MAIPTYRGRFTRFLIKQLVGRRFMRAEGSVSKLRSFDESLARSQRPPKGTRVRPEQVNGLQAKWVHGPGAGSDEVILYFHGGGFVMGSPSTHLELASRISSGAGVGVLSLDYRLAPEHPFPAALDDAKSAYHWLLDRGFEPSRIVVGGDSAGGGLALQLLLSLKGDGVHLPGGAFFLSPVTDWIDLDGESYLTKARTDPLVSLSQCRNSAALYVGDTPAENPLLRPTKMDLAGLPPLWIQVGDHEVLLSDAERLARRAEQDGVLVEFKVWPGMWHVFQAAARFVPEARDSMEELGKFVGRSLGR